MILKVVTLRNTLPDLVQETLIQLESTSSEMSQTCNFNTSVCGAVIIHGRNLKQNPKKWQTTVHKNFDYQKKPFCSLMKRGHLLNIISS